MYSTPRVLNLSEYLPACICRQWLNALGMRTTTLASNRLLNEEDSSQRHAHGWKCLMNITWLINSFSTLHAKTDFKKCCKTLPIPVPFAFPCISIIRKVCSDVARRSFTFFLQTKSSMRFRETHQCNKSIPLHLDRETENGWKISIRTGWKFLKWVLSHTISKMFPFAFTRRSPITENSFSIKFHINCYLASKAQKFVFIISVTHEIIYHYVWRRNSRTNIIEKLLLANSFGGRFVFHVENAFIKLRTYVLVPRSSAVPFPIFTTNTRAQRHGAFFRVRKLRPNLLIDELVSYLPQLHLIF